MSFLEAIRLALSSLGANKVRSALTMLGVIIGVTSVILLVSLGEGAKAYIEQQFAGLGSNLLIVTPGKQETSGGPPVVGDSVHKLTYDDATAIRRRAPSVRDVSPVIMGGVRIKHRNRSRDTMVLGVVNAFQDMRDLHVEIGSFVSDEDVETRRRVCVLGRTVKRELFGRSNPLGEWVNIGGTKFRVIGIMERKGMSLGFDIDDLVFVPVRSAQALFHTDRLFQIIVGARSSGEIDAAQRQVKEILMRRHSGTEDFTITSQAAILSTFSTILDMLTYLLGGIAGISLVVGGIGIMNIMLVSVRERTREIGIRKALGAKRTDILFQFLMESIGLSATGGLIGIGIGAYGAAIVPHFVESLPTLVSPWSVGLAFGVSVSVGVFFGVYPAWKAALQDPIEALRYE